VLSCEILRELSSGMISSSGKFQISLMICARQRSRIDVASRRSLSVDISEAKCLLQPPLARLDQPSRSAHLINSISSTVRRALSTRARIVVLQRPYATSSSSSVTTWPLSSPSPSSTDESNILEIGVILDPAEASRLVDHGPSAEDAEGSKDFQAFWGEKSELRRFKDGRILESVVWEVGDAQDERALIVGRSVRYILKRHFDIEDSSVNVESSAGYLPLLRLPSSAVDIIATEEGTKVEGFRPAMQAYQELYRTLKGMDDLPLSLLNVFPVAEGLRYSSVFPPLPLDVDRFSLSPDCLKYIEPMEVVVQFESSGRWPDELAAIQKIKLAFFEKMARSFQAQFEGSLVEVGIDSVIDEEGGLMTDNCFLEIFLPSGYAFRLRIHHDREKTLLERMIADKKATKPPLRRLAQKALDLHLCRFTHLPRHHAAVNSLHHLYPSFTPTVRLVKRWFASHLLAPHVPAELIELICANVYLTPTTTTTPSSSSAGFARVISLLARWKWRSSPLFVPLYSAAGLEAGKKVALPKDKRDAAIEAFKKMRATDPNVSSGALFVATEEDPSGRVFGASTPSKVIAGRMVQIAKATLNHLETAGKEGTLDVQVSLHPLSPLHPHVLSTR
jgi:U3 small nucleolar RNA-associated protein 22